MTQEEFKIAVDELFKDFKIFGSTWDSIPNKYCLTNDSIIEFGMFTRSFHVWNRKLAQYNYKSPVYDDNETYFDAIIIFKELILPKLLEEYDN